MNAEALGVLRWMGTVDRHDGRNRDRHDGSGLWRVTKCKRNAVFDSSYALCTYLPMCEKSARKNKH